MKDYESPIDFIYSARIGETDIYYENIAEIGQGGPQVGDLHINGQIIAGYQFGGPYILSKNSFFAPAYVRDKWHWNFRLARINLSNLTVSLIGDNKSLVYLSKIENDRIYFYDDISKSKISYINYNKRDFLT